MNKAYTYDVIVVGGGHAGIEAAHAAANMGSKTLLITLDTNKIGLMPCNPAIGGVGKGHIVFEISALGGLMPKLCTQTYLQARMLNTRKGPAVQGLRLQIDKEAYNQLSKKTLEALPSLSLRNGMVEEVLVNEQKQVTGVRTQDGSIIAAPTVILTTGTFLNGRIHIGTHNYSAGRRDEQAVTTLSDCLRNLGLHMQRLKTGTPPRLSRASLDFSKMEQQEDDNLNYLFEFYPHNVVNKRACYITRTNEATHTIIRENLNKSAMYSGNITGIGPRYCPSIEDKIARFPDKTSHQIFVEPETETCDEIYPNGISTSLPLDIQEQYIRSINGFEHAIITKAGYAVEYDFVLPNQLNQTLEVQKVPGLFLAGQINGTTGYEEAAGQGMLAGINAHLKAHNLPEFILDRTESYIGVMIDDLVTMGVDEPYRMFTSRAERRLLLRQDNAFLRLTPKAYQLGLIDEQLYADFVHEKQLIEDTVQKIYAEKTITHLLTLFEDMQTHKAEIVALTSTQLSDRALQTIHAQLRYAPYLERELKEVERREQYKALKIPVNFAYKDLPGLSIELQQKLSKHQPATIAQASLIPGMTPAAVSLLICTIKRRN
ncbi:MAG TPA: tRNA uridine-5-carboxymethylaminomethyl(34) synthesis enzyme MnmG [Candidatus Dependentiae bacterium]|nr:tRNA uridine-5-carboxymethylaminomethyl(34) synthesis enzyme MnmG [Candidatus Dependentiae bacterium]HRQ62798.1 tRNA uridine-5-carboxymethylaminomethyl(34) synthesis enzyme MnmG [Candidatus Dependentiae bacterium]